MVICFQEKILNFVIINYLTNIVLETIRAAMKKLPELLDVFNTEVSCYTSHLKLQNRLISYSVDLRDVAHGL